MAIDFACPLCRAVLRAPAGAGGRLADCPHCGGELAVPGGELPADVRKSRLFVPVGVPLDAARVAAAVDGVAPPATAAARTTHTPPAAAPAVDADAAPVPPPGGLTEPTDDEPVLLTAVEDDEPPAPAPQPAVVTPTRRRSRRKRGVPWAAVLMLLVFGGVIGGAGWVLYQRLAPPSSAVAATLTGRPVDAADVPPATLLAPAGADPAAVRALGNGLPMKSAVVEVVLRATGDEEVEVTVSPGGGTRLVAVRLADDPAVRAWLENTDAVYAAKRKELSAARGAFFAAVAEAAKNDAPPEVAAYRDTVALNAATGELGWSVEAVAAGKPHPAVRETADGAVIFAVPRGAESFTIRGRDLPDVGRAFPSNYAVTIP